MSTAGTQQFTVAVVCTPGPLRGQIVAALDDADIVDRAESVRAARADGRGPAVVVLADGPGGTTLPDSVAACGERWPDAVVIVVCDCGHGRAGTPDRLMRAGVDGIVELGGVERSLMATIAAVRAGQTCVPHALRARLAPPSLSRRERQTLGLVVMGLSNGEIAGQLHLTESTVKSHLTGAYRKLGVASRAEAVERLLDPVDGLGPGVLSIFGGGG